MKRTSVRIGVAILIVAFLLWFFLRSPSRSIDIEGTVVRDSDGTPVSAAQVLITVRETRFMEVTRPCLLTCLADHEGRFRIQATLPIRVDELRIEACALDNHYAIDENPGSAVVLRVKPIGYNNDLAPNLCYGSFVGRFGHREMNVTKVQNSLESKSN